MIPLIKWWHDDFNDFSLRPICYSFWYSFSSMLPVPPKKIVLQSTYKTKKHQKNIKKNILFWPKQLWVPQHSWAASTALIVGSLQAGINPKYQSLRWRNFSQKIIPRLKKQSLTKPKPGIQIPQENISIYSSWLLRISCFAIDLVIYKRKSRNRNNLSIESRHIKIQMNTALHE